MPAYPGSPGHSPGGGRKMVVVEEEEDRERENVCDCTVYFSALLHYIGLIGLHVVVTCLTVV